jgi:thiol-disulfide isomerase/thioredoxin
MLLEPVPVPPARSFVISSRPLNFVVLGLAVMAAGCDRQSGEKAQPPAMPASNVPSAPASPPASGVLDRSHKGEPLPEVTVRNPAGEMLKLAELKGPVLINLWATWCAPCVTELPQLDKLAADRAGKLKVVTVSQDMGDGPKVAEFLKGKGLTRLEPWLDPQNDLAFKYGGGTLPTTILYDAAGSEVWRFVGGHDWTRPETAKMLAEGGI